MKQLPDNNPPFTRPFLCLNVKEPGGKECRWYIDVGGRIEIYIDGQEPTALLQDMCAELATRGYVVDLFGKFDSVSSGPTHILRHGAFFKRMIEELEEPLPRPSKLVYIENC